MSNFQEGQLVWAIYDNVWYPAQVADPNNAPFPRLEQDVNQNYYLVCFVEDSSASWVKPDVEHIQDFDWNDEEKMSNPLAAAAIAIVTQNAAESAEAADGAEDEEKRRKKKEKKEKKKQEKKEKHDKKKKERKEERKEKEKRKEDSERKKSKKAVKRETAEGGSSSSSSSSEEQNLADMVRRENEKNRKRKREAPAENHEAEYAANDEDFRRALQGDRDEEDERFEGGGGGDGTVVQGEYGHYSYQLNERRGGTRASRVGAFEPNLNESSGVLGSANASITGTLRELRSKYQKIMADASTSDGANLLVVHEPDYLQKFKTTMEMKLLFKNALEVCKDVQEEDHQPLSKLEAKEISKLADDVYSDEKIEKLAADLNLLGRRPPDKADKIRNNNIDVHFNDDSCVSGVAKLSFQPLSSVSSSNPLAAASGGGNGETPERTLGSSWFDEALGRSSFRPRPTVSLKDVHVMRSWLQERDRFEDLPNDVQAVEPVGAVAKKFNKDYKALNVLAERKSRRLADDLAALESNSGEGEPRELARPSTLATSDFRPKRIDFSPFTVSAFGGSSGLLGGQTMIESVAPSPNVDPFSIPIPFDESEDSASDTSDILESTRRQQLQESVGLPVPSSMWYPDSIEENGETAKESGETGEAASVSFQQQSFANIYGTPSNRPTIKPTKVRVASYRTKLRQVICKELTRYLNQEPPVLSDHEAFELVARKLTERAYDAQCKKSGKSKHMKGSALTAEDFSEDQEKQLIVSIRHYMKDYQEKQLHPAAPTHSGRSSGGRGLRSSVRSETRATSSVYERL